MNVVEQLPNIEVKKDILPKEEIKTLFPFEIENLITIWKSFSLRNI